MAAFGPVYVQGDPGSGEPGSGIGDYDLASAADRVFPFDFASSGKCDHLVLYRSGSGKISIVAPVGDDTFVPVFTQGEDLCGIGGYDLASSADLAFGYDFDSTGRLDHLVLYRPGTGKVTILEHSGDDFVPVVDEVDGIGGYDLASAADRAFAFDYDSSGKLDHLVLYRPGSGQISILERTADTFAPVFEQDEPGVGIGGFDLASPADRVFAYDFASTGKSDHLVLYRPGTGAISILAHTTAGTFTPVYTQVDPGGAGIGGFDLASPVDRAFPLDLTSVGKGDHLVLYRRGTGKITILEHPGADTFTPVLAQDDGIAGYDLAAEEDRAFAYDAASTGKPDHLGLYRPGTGTIWILRRELAPVPQPLVRRDVWSLRTDSPWDPITEAYAHAVAIMQARPATDPTSWTYQASMHGAYASPPRGAQWNECQHQSWHFLPWHRMYLYYFERIVRAAVASIGGPADFALPYWNYDQPFPANTLPDPFRQPTLPGPDATPNPLFLAPPRRNTFIAQGFMLPPEVTSSAAAFALTNFSARPGGTSFGGGRQAAAHFGGSLGALEITPHGAIHVQLGGPRVGACEGGFMVDPNCAAFDPIFWLHHSNVDRLWNEWLALGEGRANPTEAAWRGQSFSFFDETGARVSLTGADVLDNESQLGYVYQ